MKGRRLPRDAPRDSLRQQLAIGGTLREPAFGRIGQETAFDQNGGDTGASQHVKAAPADAAILGRRSGHDVAMNAGGETSAVAAIIISLHAVGARAARGIEVNGDEGRAAVGIGDGHARPEGDEDITIARHDHPVTLGLKNAPQALGDVERQAFLADALIRNAAAIVPAMAGIDHNRALSGSKWSKRHEPGDGRGGNKPMKIHFR